MELQTLVQGGSGIPTPAHITLKEVNIEKEKLDMLYQVKINELAQSEVGKAELTQKLSSLEHKLFDRESELKTSNQESEQGTVKLNMLVRKLEDEKSKVNGL